MWQAKGVPCEGLEESSVPLLPQREVPHGLKVVTLVRELCSPPVSTGVVSRWLPAQSGVVSQGLRGLGFGWRDLSFTLRAPSTLPHSLSTPPGAGWQSM